jgi:hypothetical protein
MQSNALLAWQYFIAAKSGCYKPTPLKEILPSRFKSTRKKLWVIRFEFLFVLPTCFILGVVTPLYLAHLDYFTVCYSLCHIQDSDWSFVV